MGTTERVKKFIDFKGITRYRFCQEMGFSNKFLDNSSNMGTDKAGKILRYFPELNAEWLLTGRGNMLKVDNEKEEDIVHKEEKNEKTYTDDISIPLYDINSIEGIIDLFGENKNQIPIKNIFIPKITACDGALVIAGDSMPPLFKSGDIVIFKKIKNPAQNIIWGETYLIYLNNDGNEFFFTRILKQSTRDLYVRFVSPNPEHEPVEFPLHSIKALALVKASFRINSQF
jgi:phage repressor protein C with HTH and peptisase S24 domain